jgi:branched-chain amino acid aminotransferase
MIECFGKNFILNGELQPVESFDNSLVYEGDSIYEVLRMIGGNPVFFQDHMERLISSLKLQNKKPLADIYTLKKSIITLSRKERKKDINLKIVFNYNNGSGNYLIYFIEPIYPGAEQYRKGVKGILYFAQRKNPESKVIHHKLRSSIYHKLIQESAYEALLVNEDNLITEGSRSNIFFLKGETIVTAPENLVLNGITRKYIIEICHEKNITVNFSCVNADDLKSYDAVFMTGTSPIVLAFHTIEEMPFNVNFPVIPMLRKRYIDKAEESIRGFRTEL